MSLHRQIWGFPVTIKQYTGLVVDKKTITENIIIDRQPTEAAYLFLHFDNRFSTGTITIVGKDQDATTQTDVLVVNGTLKPQRSTYMFVHIDSITTSGLSGSVWITATDSSHEELRILKATLTKYTVPRAYMMIQIRDIRDVDVIQMPNMGLEVKTSHLGFCNKDLAVVLNQMDVVTDQYEVDFKVVYIDIPPGLKWWRVHHAEVGLLQLGSDING